MHGDAEKRNIVWRLAVEGKQKIEVLGFLNNLDDLTVIVPAADILMRSSENILGKHPVENAPGQFPYDSRWRTSDRLNDHPGNGW
jgi:hypothetical protein